MEIFFFDREQLQKVATEHHENFENAEPFPHVVIDGLLPDSLLEEVVAEFPQPQSRDWDGWHGQRGPQINKLHIHDDWMVGPLTRHLLNQCNSSVFVDFLEVLTGIEGLIPDPHYFGGGIHQIESGGSLAVHADFNHHPRLRLDRRLNALLYLNQDWKEEWGGYLELWDATMSQAEVRVAPAFNRLVVFATTDLSFHGHPDPMLTPPGVSRRSLALYYYSNARPESEISRRGRTFETDWRSRPGEETASVKMRRMAKQLVPPVAITAAKKIAKRS
jgi:Rps23 Pro-64 3,4-dihydroxylase Tpa1-like proline 4-hydroxylase